MCNYKDYYLAEKLKSGQTCVIKDGSLQNIMEYLCSSVRNNFGSTWLNKFQCRFSVPSFSFFPKIRQLAIFSLFGIKGCTKFPWG